MTIIKIYLNLQKQDMKDFEIQKYSISLKTKFHRINFLKLKYHSLF